MPLFCNMFGSRSPQPGPVTLGRMVKLPHLPNEIWAEIHSYLPPDSIHKLIGINRYFFEMGMDALYRTVCLSDFSEREQRKTLQQLQYQSVACRVRKLEISPCFLPLCDEHGETMTSRSSPSPGTDAGKASLVEKNHKTARSLAAAAEVLNNCTNLEELTIHFHFFRAMTPSFRDFLVALCSRAGRQLQTMTINMSAINFHLLAAISSTIYPELRNLHLTILPSYFVAEGNKVQYVEPSGEVAQAFKSTVFCFLTSARTSLETLTITNYDLLDLSSLFPGLGPLASLKKVEYRTCLDSSILSHPETFRHFLENSLNLVCLSLKISVPSLWDAGPPPHYKEDTLWFQTFVHDLFKLRLSTLQEFHIELPASFVDSSLSCFEKNLVQFAPNLRKLTIDPLCGRPLKYNQFLRILGYAAEFSQPGGGRAGLETFQVLRLLYFSPQHLDAALRILPDLQILAIGFEGITFGADGSQVQLPPSELNKVEEKTLQAFRTRTYLTSKLRKLYVVERPPDRSSWKGPRMNLVDSLAEALPSVKVIPDLPQ